VHFQERHDVLIERAVVIELVGKIENDIGLETLEFLIQQIEVVENGQVLGLMPQFAQRGQHIGFGLPVLSLQLGAQILIERRGRDGIEQGEYFEFAFHSGYFVRLNLPVNR